MTTRRRTKTRTTPTGEPRAQQKLDRIRKILDDYYNPPDERNTAPENIIEYVNAVLKEK